MATAQNQRPNPNRSGAATVELAVCLPLLILLAFGSIEGANLIFTRQAIVQACYEAVKESAKSSGSQERALQLAEEVLEARNIADPDIQFSPANVESLPPGSTITVTISVDGDARSLLPEGPFRNVMVSAHATMIKE